MSKTLQHQLVCGFIGLGSQGAPIARRIIDAGNQVVLWARRQETLQPFDGAQVVIAPSIEALAQQVDHVGICVAGDDGVLEVGERLIASIRPGATIAIHSTVLPETCERLGTLARQRSVMLIDAPVSGGKPAADAGQLIIMTGGDALALEKAQPIFNTFSHLQIHLGDIGSAQKAKLINNALMIANMGMVHAAVCAGVSLELRRDELIRLLCESSGRSFALETYARYTGPEAFGNAKTLLEKVRLLGQLLGEENSAYQQFLSAALQVAN